MDIENGENEYKDGVVYSSTSVTYTQNGDSNFDDIQKLDLWEEEAGGGKFLVLETSRWSFDKIEDLIEILKHYDGRRK